MMRGVTAKVTAIATVAAIGLAISSLASTALGAASENNKYTHNPGKSSHEDLIQFNVEDTAPAEMLALTPTDTTTGELAKIIEFTGWTEKPVVRYFPEETQKEIEEIGGDRDSFIMSDYMRANFSTKADEKEDVKMSADFSLDYLPGQIVVIVIGVPGEDGETEWIPVEAKVTEVGKISFSLDPETQEKINDQEQTLFTVLTKRGNGETAERKQRRENTYKEVTSKLEYIPVVGDELEEQENLIEKVVPIAQPSKNVDILTQIEDTDKTAAADETNALQEIATEAESNTGTIPEIASTAEIEGGSNSKVRVGITRKTLRKLKEKEDTLREWASETINAVTGETEEVKQEIVELMQAHPSLYGKKIYEIVHLESTGFDDTYGDILTRIRFATPYNKDQEIVVMVGCLNDAGDDVDWYELNTAVVAEGKMDVCFNELSMKSIEKYKACNLVVFSSEFADNEFNDWEIVKNSVETNANN